MLLDFTTGVEELAPREHELMVQFTDRIGHRLVVGGLATEERAKRPTQQSL
jgi:hypothetical protein